MLASNEGSKRTAHGESRQVEKVAYISAKRTLKR